MPNKYSYSNVLAQYCQAGFVTLPDELYQAYLNASSVGSRTTQSQQSTTSTTSFSEDEPEPQPEAIGIEHVRSAGPDILVHHGERGRERKPAERPHFPFSHKPSPHERATLINSFVHEIDSEPRPNGTEQPLSQSSVDAGQRSEPQTSRGVLTQEISLADPPSRAKGPNHIDRNAWKSTYPPVSHTRSSSASLAASASSSDYTLDVPRDFPVHADGDTVTSEQTCHAAQSSKPTNNSATQHIPIGDALPSEPRHGDVPQRRQGSDTAVNVSGRPANGLEPKETKDRHDVLPRIFHSPLSRQEPDDGARARTTVTKVKLHPASSYASVPSQPTRGRPRSRSRSRCRNQPKASKDNSLPSISDSVSETGIEVVDNVALSSDYDNRVKIPEHEAAAIERLPSPQPALPAGSIIPRQASPPPPIGSNETRKIQPQRRDPSRPVSATSSQTQIYAPLASTFPPDSSYTSEPAFIPESNVVRPGSLPESAVERASEPSQPRGRSTTKAHEQHAVPENYNNDCSDQSSDSGSVGIPSVRPSLPPPISTSPNNNQSGKRDSRYTPIYRDRKQEWLSDPAHSVAHYREAFKVGRRKFGSIAYGSPGGTRIGDGEGEGSVARRLNSMPKMIVAPKFPEAEQLEDFDVRRLSASEASEVSDSASASSGFYPPDIPRYRDESSAGSRERLSSGVGRFGIVAQQKLMQGGELWRRREDNGVGVGVEVAAISGRSPPSGSGSLSSRKKQNEEKKGGQGLLRRLRGVSLSAIR